MNAIKFTAYNKQVWLISTIVWGTVCAKIAYFLTCMVMLIFRTFTGIYENYMLVFTVHTGICTAC